MSQLMLVNPRRRRRSTAKKRKTVSRRRSPVRRVSTRAVRKVRRRRNPIRRGGFQGIINNSVMPAATAAVGAVGLGVIWNYIPVPDMLKTGPMRHVAKAAGAIGLGMLAEMVVSKKTADQFATGALTVVMYDAMRETMSNFAPGVNMGEYMDGVGYYGSGINADESLGVYLDQPAAPSMDSGMGAYDYNEMTL